MIDQIVGGVLMEFHLLIDILACPAAFLSFLISSFFTKNKEGDPGPPGPSPRSAAVDWCWDLQETTLKSYVHVQCMPLMVKLNILWISPMYKKM